MQHRELAEDRIIFDKTATSLCHRSQRTDYYRMVEHVKVNAFFPWV